MYAARRLSSQRGIIAKLKLLKKKKDYFKCVLRRRSYPPGTSHYLVPKGLGFLNVIYLYPKKTNINSITEITMTQSICQP